MATVLVIGASRGIGLAFVQQYLAAHDRVIATARDEAGLERLRGLGAEALLLDVTDPASVSGLAWMLDGVAVDVALYVAGVYDSGDAQTPPTREAFDRVMHTNVLGAMQAMPQVLPAVAAAGGVFAVLTSGLSLIGEVTSSSAWLYRVSKAALNMALVGARHSYPGATCVALDPGWVRTDMGGPSAPLTAERSVADLRRTLASVTADDNGHFLHRDGRRAASW
ncbi:SDR family oxidoreductase [Hydrogenophaga sp.]|uniref:SDR family oxidoreductase n=1 Tax=Hydrogenophaga sp. TaxID=1904254 RepID=UPI003D0E90F6